MEVTNKLPTTKKEIWQTLSKIDVNKILSSPKEHLMEIAKEFYASNKTNIKRSIDSGKELANNILKENGKNKDKEI